MTTNPPDSESALKFCRLLREGRLFEAEAWLKAWKPAQYDLPNPRCTPLGIAIDTGFHSMLELLVRNGFYRLQNTSQWLFAEASRAL
jgi:hypothetical protein